MCVCSSMACGVLIALLGLGRDPKQAHMHDPSVLSVEGVQWIFPIFFLLVGVEFCEKLRESSSKRKCEPFSFYHLSSVLVWVCVGVVWFSPSWPLHDANISLEYKTITGRSCAKSGQGFS